MIGVLTNPTKSAKIKAIMKAPQLVLIFLALFFFSITAVSGEVADLLTPAERLWLESRNNTIVVYPEKNNPPFSYTSAGGNIQGLAIDYMELIAEKVGMEVEYLSPQSRSQIVSEFRGGKGDVAVTLMEIDSRTDEFIFTDSYVTVPTVIVVRKDVDSRKSLTLSDFNGKRISVVADSTLEEYVRGNYPRVVIEDVTDNEVSLQQVILGEVDGAVMDIASLSYYLSKQVLSSVKVVGNTGLDYKPAFALRKDYATLQSILEKGMTQISTADRALLTDKWVGMAAEAPKAGFLDKNANMLTLYVLLGLIIFVSLVLFLRHKRHESLHWRLHKAQSVNELKEELTELEKANALLEKEMKIVKEEEDKLQGKIEELDK